MPWADGFAYFYATIGVSCYLFYQYTYRKSDFAEGSADAVISRVEIPQRGLRKEYSVKISCLVEKEHILVRRGVCGFWPVLMPWYFFGSKKED